MVFPKLVCLMSTSAPESRNPAADTEPVSAFSVTAQPSPGVMPRVLELFAKRGLVPTYWHATANDAQMAIDIRMQGMEPSLADYIGRCLRQIHLVDRVLVIHDAETDRAADSA
jgi:acetolactate synthase regulatory subunit